MASTRTRAESELLRKRIWDLYLSGEKSEPEIGDLLKITQQAVSYHIRICVTGFVHNNFTQAGYWLAREIEKCNFGESECWKIYNEARRAWKKSIGKTKVTRQKAKPQPIIDQDGKPVMENGKPKLGMSHIELNVQEEDVAGDPRFLVVMTNAQNEIRAWQTRRSKLLGLDQPKRFKPELSSHGDVESMTDDQLRQEYLNGLQFIKGDERMLEEIRRTVGLLPAAKGVGGNGHGGNGHGPN